MVISNMVMKFHNFDIFGKICSIFDMSSALAYRLESIKLITITWFIAKMNISLSGRIQLFDDYW